MKAVPGSSGETARDVSRKSRVSAPGTAPMSVDYDQLTYQYERYRKPDPRIAERIHFHLRGARQVLNVGAGMGSYEPNGCEVVAVEPVRGMISGRKE